MQGNGNALTLGITAGSFLVYSDWKNCLPLQRWPPKCKVKGEMKDEVRTKGDCLFLLRISREKESLILLDCSIQSSKIRSQWRSIATTARPNFDERWWCSAWPSGLVFWFIAQSPHSRKWLLSLLRRCSLKKPASSDWFLLYTLHMLIFEFVLLLTVEDRKGHRFDAQGYRIFQSNAPSH